MLDLERLASHKQRDARHGCKVERRLPGRVPRADQMDVEAVGHPRFAARRAIIDALSDEPVEAFDRKAPPRDARG